MNAWDAFAAAPFWFVLWTVGVGFSIGLALGGVAALVRAIKGSK